MKTTIEIEVPAAWENYFDTDGLQAIRYWASCVACPSADTWLLWEHNDTEENDEATELAYAALVDGKALPEGFYLVTREILDRAFGEAVRLYGERMANDCDGETRDYSLQVALFGRVQYS